MWRCLLSVLIVTGLINNAYKEVMGRICKFLCIRHHYFFNLLCIWSLINSPPPRRLQLFLGKETTGRSYWYQAFSRAALYTYLILHRIWGPCMNVYLIGSLLILIMLKFILCIRQHKTTKIFFPTTVWLK